PTLPQLHLPAGARSAAGESLGATSLLLGHGGAPSGPAWASAQDAFVHAMHVTALGSASVAFLGFLVVAAWLPGKRRDAAAPPVARHGTGTDEAHEPVAVEVGA